MKREFSAGVIIYKISNNNQRLYLLLLYPKGYWDLPKGKLEFNETNLDALINSDFEEKLSYSFKDFKGRAINKEVTFFVGQAVGEKVILSKEHLNYKWATFEDSIELLTFENAKNILNKAEQFLMSVNN